MDSSDNRYDLSHFQWSAQNRPSTLIRLLGCITENWLQIDTTPTFLAIQDRYLLKELNI